MARFAHLLAPGRIGSLELRNRIVHAPMSLGLGAGDGTCGEHHIAYHEARARGGAGLIDIGTVSVGYPKGAVDAKQIAISDDRFIPSLRSLADAIHRHDSKVVLQLNHNGLMAGLDRAEGRALATPSLPVHKPSEVGAAYLPDELGELGRASRGQPEPTYNLLDPDEIAEIVELYAAAAARGREAGIDAVEIHGGHGYLLSSFLSPATNRRSDAYGGALKNRARFLLEVIRAVRARVGDDYPVWCKIDSEEFYQDEGITLDDARQTAIWAEDAGADAIGVSAYYDGSRAAAHFSAHTPAHPELLVQNAHAIKAAVNVPVLTAGRIEAEAADRHIAEGCFDFVLMGRKLLADPDLPAKLDAGEPETVRPCTYCYGCISQAYFRRSILCVVNPEMGHEVAVASRPAAAAKRIVVVGGGPAGLEAARRLALDGHEITLFERSVRLGGRLHASAALTPEDAELRRWLVTQVESLPIDVRLKTEATPERIQPISPEAVVLAVGRKMDPPEVPGIDLPHVLAGEALVDWIEAGDFTLQPKPQKGLQESRRDARPRMPRAVVVGGGHVGLPLALRLANQGVRVVVLEEEANVGRGLSFVRRLSIRDDLRKAEVPLLMNARELQLTDEGIAYTNGLGQRRSLGADRVLVTTRAPSGPDPSDALASGAYLTLRVGECGDALDLTDSLHGAMDVANELAKSLT